MTGIRQHLSLSHTKPRMFVLPSECVLRYRSRSSVALTRARPLFNTVCPPSGGIAREAAFHDTAPRKNADERWHPGNSRPRTARGHASEAIGMMVDKDIE